ncbi:MAG: hypothetical protein R3A52_18460 [Polyangiales bacterium]
MPPPAEPSPEPTPEPDAPMFDLSASEPPPAVAADGDFELDFVDALELPDAEVDLELSVDDDMNTAASCWRSTTRARPRSRSSSRPRRRSPTALLAATVTSRRRVDDDHEKLYARSAKDEARARMELLVEQAASADDYDDAAEWLAHAAEIAEGALGDPARARALTERALALSPTSVTGRRPRAASDGSRRGRTRRAALAHAEAELAPEPARPSAAQLLWWEGEVAAAHDPARASEAWAKSSAAARRARWRAFSAAASRDLPRRPTPQRTRARLAGPSHGGRARLSRGRGQRRALDAAREAARRDPTDAGAWFAIARIGLSGPRRW